MAGISAIGLIGYMNRLSYSTGGQPLTPATKAKLEALGIDTSNIKTEAEGKARLIAAQAERSSSAEKTSKSSKSNSNDDVMEKVKQLADDLNVSYSDNDTVDDIIDKISSKVEKLIAEAENDESKQPDAVYYKGRLNEVMQMQQSQIDLSASMSVSANMNIAFHEITSMNF